MSNVNNVNCQQCQMSTMSIVNNVKSAQICFCLFACISFFFVWLFSYFCHQWTHTLIVFRFCFASSVVITSFAFEGKLVMWMIMKKCDIRDWVACTPVTHEVIPSMPISLLRASVYCTKVSPSSSSSSSSSSSPSPSSSPPALSLSLSSRWIFFASEFLRYFF